MPENVPEWVPKLDDDSDAGASEPDEHEEPEEQEEPEEDNLPSQVIIWDLPTDIARETPDDAKARKVVAIVLSVGFVVAADMVVFGGLVGRFSPQMVAMVLAELGAAAAAIRFYYFRRRSP